MATQTSNIDDVLIGYKTQIQPHTPEHNDAPDVDLDVELPRETLGHPEIEDEVKDKKTPADSDEYGLDEPKVEPPKLEADEYGNEKAATKTYTEDEVNERINSTVRERLARAERNSPPVQQQVQQQTQHGFEYNAESNESWQQQLESFVEQTVSKMSQKQAQQAHQQREQQAVAEFEQRFQQGMNKFNDFKDVVGSQPITDAMLLAARSTKDPAAFIYAASKRMPQDLKEISQMTDPYAQVAAMGRLEERLKQTKTGTKAPKPISRTNADSSIPHKSDKQPSIEQLIAIDAAKKLERQKQRRR